MNDGRVAVRSSPRIGDVPWENDTILPAQFFARQGDCQLSPERRLMLAVLEDAVDVALKPPPILSLISDTKRRWDAQDEAREWIQSDRRGPFTFADICDELGLDADYVRGGVRAAIDRLLPGFKERRA